MPKRKHTKDDIDYISEQIKKLKKKMKRVRKQKDSSTSSDNSSEPVECNNSNKDNSLLEELMAEPSKYNEDVLPVEQSLLEISESGPVLSNTDTTTDLDITNTDQTSNEAITTECEEASLDKEVLEILGDDPANKDQYGQEIHKELASRLQHIATTGLTKESKKELQLMYLLPSNGILLGAPTINPEIKAALPESLANRDKAIEAKQKLLGSAISCLASATSEMLASQDKNHKLLKKLMDANRILCDIQHSDSVTRRMFSTSVLKKDVKIQILNSKIDKLLFGENLPDALRTAKAVSKSSAEIKSTYNLNKKPQPSTSKAGNLNVKAPVAPFRKPPVTTQKTRQTAPHQNQPGRSYKTSSQQQKHNNYRRT